MRLPFFLFLLFLPIAILSQNYVQVNQVAIQKNTYTINNNNNIGLTNIAYAINSFRNSWDNNKKREREIQKAKAQLEIIKRTYDDHENYPESIIDGWHIVSVTDNFNYCTDAKVFIDNNQIIKFVINNYSAHTLDFKMITPIKNGKALLSLDLLDGNTDTVEVYFINDLNGPQTVEKPQDAGYISFWSDMNKAKSIKIWIEDMYYGELGKQFDDEPECYEEGTISLGYRPGVYKFKAAGRGTINWLGTFEIKENSCLILNLNKDNRN
ncbi:hypothetical protein ACFPH8_05480 [Bizionia hallyeonensis]|uniref:Uncharacterized protein n=1 Tax=Bizionia hallyeonensis TaxID=1123757 RepID=A0ABW0C402_9FLAO